MTNRDLLVVLLVPGCEETGRGRATQNPASLRERFAGGISIEELVRFDIKDASKVDIYHI